MSYINGNNIYGVRKIKESPSKSYLFNHNEINMEEELVADKECSCHEHKSEKYHHHDDNNDCNKDCHKKDDGWDCKSSDKCCKGDTCVFDPSKAKCICSYMDILFSENATPGSPFFFDFDSNDGSNYTINAKYKSTDPHCCMPCVIDDSSIFEIDSAKVTFTLFQLVSTLNPDSLLINGTPVPAELTPSSNLIATIPNSFLSEDCSECNKGTSVTAVLNKGGTWKMIMKVELCGRVKTNTNTCKFIILFENDVPSAEIFIVNESVFVAPNICLPNVESTEPIKLNTQFSATANLITPSITVESVDPVVLRLTGNMMVNPSANIQIMQNTKVCFNAMI